MAFRWENAPRLIALVVLCGLVYYFSFDQGQIAIKEDVRRLNKTIEILERQLEAKERVIERLAGEVRELKDKISEAKTAPETAPEANEENTRLVIQENASRTLLDDRLVVACLEIDPGRKWARLQVNMVKEDVIHTESVGLGQNMRFYMGDRPVVLILEQIDASRVSIRVVKM